MTQEELLFRYTPWKGASDRQYFKSIIIGAKTVSVQASSRHHCEPKVDGLEPWQYTMFEVKWSDKEEPTSENWLTIYESLKAEFDKTDSWSKDFSDSIKYTVIP